MKNALFLILLAGCGSGGSPAPEPAAITYDIFTDTTGRQEVACPPQTSTTAVLFTFGQSNSANSLETKYTSTKVLNYFNGKCYLAQDPLLGATGTEGSLWTELGNRFNDQVILIPRGISGTTVKNWAVNDWLTEGMKTPYVVTHFLWAQGEGDNGKSATEYEANLRIIIAKTKASFPDSGFWVTISTICNNAPDLNIQQAQRAVIGPGVFQGPDTDTLDPSPSRCHLGAATQSLTIDEWARIIAH
jgi:hypothetical protein